MSGPRQYGAGFTLVEILVAIVVVAAILPMAMWVQSVAWGGTGTANRMRIAAQLARNQVDSIKVQTVRNDTTPPNGDYAGFYQNGVQVFYTVADALRDTSDSASTVANACKVIVIARDNASGDTLLTAHTFVTRDF
jgi:prepilin-type N-terminal cleavage/methylation domain-containing protein